MSVANAEHGTTGYVEVSKSTVEEEKQNEVIKERLGKIDFTLSIPVTTPIVSIPINYTYFAGQHPSLKLEPVVHALLRLPAIDMPTIVAIYNFRTDSELNAMQLASALAIDAGSDCAAKDVSEDLEVYDFVKWISKTLIEDVSNDYEGLEVFIDGCEQETCWCTNAISCDLNDAE